MGHGNVHPFSDVKLPEGMFWEINGSHLESFTGWCFQTWLVFSISYMGCHPNPIDELIFSEGYEYHQPEYIITY